MSSESLKYRLAKHSASVMVTEGATSDMTPEHHHGFAFVEGWNRAREQISELVLRSEGMAMKDLACIVRMFGDDE